MPFVNNLIRFFKKMSHFFCDSKINHYLCSANDGSCSTLVLPRTCKRIEKYAIYPVSMCKIGSGFFAYIPYIIMQYPLFLLLSC